PARTLPSADLGDDSEWVLRILAPSLPADRGAFDAEHHPVLVATAEQGLEPLEIGGMTPQVHATLVLRLALPDVALTADFDAMSALVTLEGDLADSASAVLSCGEDPTAPDAASTTVYP